MRAGEGNTPGAGGGSAQHLPNADAAVRFLRGWAQGWPPGSFLTLCELREVGMTAKSWPAGDVASGYASPGIAKWLGEANGARRNNVYFSANPVATPMVKKPAKTDIAAIVTLHADIDLPNNGAPYAERRAAIEAGMEKLATANAPGLHVIDSGNGANVLLRLAEPMAAERMAEAELASRGMADTAGKIIGCAADAVQNVDRVLRLPGTLNWPTATKLKKGYPDRPRLARLLCANGGGLRPERIEHYAQQGRAAEAKARLQTGTGAGRAPVLMPPSEEAPRVDALAANLMASWGEISTDMTAAERARLDAAADAHPGLRRRWEGDTEGLADASASGLTMALAACLKAANYDAASAAKVLLACPHTDILAPKHPEKNSQARAIARAWVRSAAMPRENAEADERIAASGRGSAERALRDALKAAPDVVVDMLPFCIRRDAACDAGFARMRDDLARRAGMGVRDISQLRQSAIVAGDRARAEARRREDAAGRAVLDLGAGLDDLVAACTNALAGSEPPQVFIFGGAPVEIAAARPAAAPDTDAGRHHESDRLGASIVTLTHNTMCHALARVAVFTRGGKSAEPPLNVARVLVDRGALTRLPPVRMVSSSPVMQPDGRVVQQQGYDRESQVFLAADWASLALSANPSREDAQAAMNALRAPFTEFPFADSSGAAALMAHILHTLTRHLMPVVPAIVFAAPAAGAGKSLLANMASLIAQGRAPAIMPALAGRDTAEETRKRITSMLREGRSDIVFDNVQRGAAIGDLVLDSLLTASVWTDRVLGVSRSVELPNNAVLAFTGNNIRTRGDTARRVIWAYLEPGEARPETRRFSIDDLEGHIRRERPRLLAAALTVLRAHIMHNKPLTGGCSAAPLLGSFEAWSRLVAAGVEWAGGGSPIAANEWGRERFDAGAEDAQGLETLLVAMHDLFEGKACSAAEILDARDVPYPAQTAETETAAASRRAISEAIGKLMEGHRGALDATALGKMLKAEIGRVTENGWALKEGRETRNKTRTYFAAKPGM